MELAYNSLYRNAKSETGTFDLTAISVTGQYTYDLSRDVSLLGNFGIHQSSYKLKGGSVATGSSSGLVLGVKIQYDLSESLAIRGGFDAYTESGGMTGSLTQIGLAVITRF